MKLENIKMYKNHKERIIKNYDKFKNGTWTPFSYSFDFDCDENWVRSVLNEIMIENLENYRFEINGLGLELPEHKIIEIPDSIEIHPDRIIEHENHVELIYKSKIQ